MNEEYDVSFSLEGKEYEGKVTIPDANKNLTEDEKINSVKRHSKGLAKKYSQKDVKNLTVKKRNKAMNRIISIMIILVLGNINIMFAQNTSLVVDNQTPGWLSNKIPFKDQESVKNLTVTGYLNGTDIKFIRELLNNRQLAHLDLSDANIVAGGDAYYSTSEYSYTIDKDNRILKYMFTGKKLNYLSLPKSIEVVTDSKFYTSLDTLVIGGNFKILNPWYVEDNINYLYIREGVDSLAHPEFNSSSIKAKKIHLPTTINYLPHSIFYGTHKNINVENIKYFENRCVRVYDFGDKTGIIDNDTIIFSKELSFWNANAFKLNDGTTIFLNDGLKRISLMWKDYRGNYEYDKGALGAKNLIIHTDSKTPVEILYYDKVSSLLNTATVYVPKGCAEIYRKKAPWSNATILEEKVPVTGITLDQENISFSNIGASVLLTATVLPTDADNQKVIWKSSDTNVATVKDGKVTCTGYGTAIITATSEEGEYVATCNVTATKRVVLPSSITLDRKEATIKVGEATTLKANVLPADADDKTIVWSSENSDIASVTNDGVVTGHKAGTTKIIVTTNANGLKDECIITVLQPATGIALDRQEISFSNIGETVQLTANVLPEDASNKNVSWASSDTKVAIVSNGKVVCTGYGTAVISAVSEDGGYMATCIITANKNVILPSSITLDKSAATINVGESFTLNANVLPDNADNKIIVWNSDDADIASVNNEGEVTGLKAGTTKIIAMTQANDLKAECLITVLQPVTGITLDRNDIYFVEIGESVQLIANVLPEDASNKNVVWTSSNVNVATVNDGVVVCMGYGSAVITASTEDGGYKAICVINATSGIAGINDGNKCNEIKRYDATGREIKNPVNGLNIIKTQDGRVIKTTVRIK